MEHNRENNYRYPEPHGIIPAHAWERRSRADSPPVKKRRALLCADPMDDGKLPRNEPPGELPNQKIHPRNSVHQWLRPDSRAEDESSESGLECLLEDSGSGAASALDDDEMQQIGSATPPSELQYGSELNSYAGDAPPKAKSDSNPCMTEPKVTVVLTKSELIHQLKDRGFFKNEFFEVRPSKLGGLGAFAAQDLTKGDVILREEPILLSDDYHLFEDFEKLDKDAKLVALSLAKNDEMASSIPPLGAVWETNSFATRHRRGDSGLFAVASRFNHSCRPANSVEFAYDKKLGCITLTVETDTSKDSELTICYQPLKKPYELWYQYGFKCHCGACAGLSDSEIQAWEALNW